MIYSGIHGHTIYACVCVRVTVTERAYAEFKGQQVFCLVRCLRSIRKKQSTDERHTPNALNVQVTQNIRSTLCMQTT